MQRMAHCAGTVVVSLRGILEGRSTNCLPLRHWSDGSCLRQPRPQAVVAAATKLDLDRLAAFSCRMVDFVRWRSLVASRHKVFALHEGSSNVSCVGSVQIRLYLPKVYLIKARSIVWTYFSACSPSCRRLPPTHRPFTGDREAQSCSLEEG